MERGILLELSIASSTQASLRNEEEKSLSYDISNNQGFSEQVFSLSANNAQGNAAKSTKILGPVESFLYLYAPWPVRVTLTKGAETLSFTMENVLLLSAPFDLVNVTNLDLEKTVTMKVIVS